MSMAQRSSGGGGKGATAQYMFEHAPQSPQLNGIDEPIYIPLLGTLWIDMCSESATLTVPGRWLASLPRARNARLRGTSSSCSSCALTGEFVEVRGSLETLSQGSPRTKESKREPTKNPDENRDLFCGPIQYI